MEQHPDARLAKLNTRTTQPALGTDESDRIRERPRRRLRQLDQVSVPREDDYAIVPQSSAAKAWKVEYQGLPTIRVTTLSRCFLSPPQGRACMTEDHLLPLITACKSASAPGNRAALRCQGSHR
jgi:hypothetical protein